MKATLKIYLFNSLYWLDPNTKGEKQITNLPQVFYLNWA